MYSPRQTAATTANTIKKHKNSDLKKFAIEIISGAIKERRNAVNCVRNHAKYFNFVSEELLQLRKWMSTLKVNLEAAISSLNRVETLRYELLTKSVRKQIIDGSECVFGFAQKLRGVSLQICTRKT